MAHEDEDEESVGYGKPPRWGRFEKGKSGNPRGRPRKARGSSTSSTGGGLDRMLREELDRQLTIKEGGKVRKLSVLQIAARAQLAAAAKGNTNAQRDVIKQALALAEREDERDAMAEAERRAQLERLLAFKRHQARAWSAAERLGTEPETPWPHPDDIIIDTDAGFWHVRGPLSESDLPSFEYCRAERDAAFAHAAIECLTVDDLSQASKKLLVVRWQAWDILLPKRWQIANDPLAWERIWDKPLPKLRQHHHNVSQLAQRLRPQGPARRTREEYRRLNALWRPVLLALGYRSLAQFEKGAVAGGSREPTTGI